MKSNKRYFCYHINFLLTLKSMFITQLNLYKYFSQNNSSTRIPLTNACGGAAGAISMGGKSGTPKSVMNGRDDALDFAFDVGSDS